MVYQFLYGRKKEGYCQVNHDRMPFNKNELLKIEGLKTYTIAEGLSMNDLPQAFYYYNERMDNQYVGILGKTVFVPAGTSEESGSRDTCFLHAYILDGDDYLHTMKHPGDLFRNREYYESVEEYQQKGVPSYMNYKQEEEIPYSEIESAFSLDDQKLADFIKGCYKAFSDSGKRVYCYLPANDKQGSKYAARLMQLILSVMPASIIMGAGFLTYTSTYHNPSNPIPGNIGVVFIPDNPENKMQAKYEKDRNYIFDFKNYISPIEDTEVQFINNVIDAMLKLISGRNEKNLIELRELYIDLEQAILPLNRISSGFIGAYGFLWRLWKNVYEKLTRDVEVGEGHQITWERYKEYQTYMPEINLKIKQTAAHSIYDCLLCQPILTPYARIKILNILNALLITADYNNADLDWIDRIYSGGDLCRREIIQRLCDRCLYLVENQYDTAQIVNITSYMYVNEEINGNIIDLIYSSREYYSVAQRLIEATLAPLSKNSKLNVAEKVGKIFSSVKSFYKQYPNLVLDEAFKAEIKKVINSIMPQPYKYVDISSLFHAIFDLEPILQKAFREILQDICYNLIENIANGSIKVEKSYHKEIYRWAEKIDLFHYDTLPANMTNTVKRFEGYIKRLRIAEGLKSKDPIEVSKGLSSCGPIELDKICGEMEDSFIISIKQYGNESYLKEGYYVLFFELFKTNVRSIPKEIVASILRMEGLSGIRAFYNEFLLTVPGKEIEYKSLTVLKQVVKNHINFGYSKNEYAKEDLLFLESIGLIDFTDGRSGSRYENGYQERKYKKQEDLADDKEFDLSRSLKSSVRDMLFEEKYNINSKDKNSGEKNIHIQNTMSADEKKTKHWPFGSK